MTENLICLKNICIPVIPKCYSNKKTNSKINLMDFSTFLNLDIFATGI